MTVGKILILVSVGPFHHNNTGGTFMVVVAFLIHAMALIPICCGIVDRIRFAFADEFMRHRIICGASYANVGGRCAKTLLPEADDLSTLASPDALKPEPVKIMNV